MYDFLLFKKSISIAVFFRFWKLIVSQEINKLKATCVYLSVKANVSLHLLASCLANLFDKMALDFLMLQFCISIFTFKRPAHLLQC
jgi:hypothetical protein